MSEGGFSKEQSGADIVPISGESDQRDGFSCALEMMKRNGTDEQTQRVYVNILDVMKLNMDRFSAKTSGFRDSLGENNPILGLFGGHEKPRVEIPGMPIVNADGPNNPSFDLRANYHNGPEWIATVCVDDPTMANGSAYKLNGELNEAFFVQILPGDEANPGNMYSKIPGREKQLLTPALRQRIDDAFQVCKEQSIAVAAGRSLIGYVPHEILSGFRYRNGNKLVKGRDEMYSHDLYKLILGGKVVRKSGNERVTQINPQSKQASLGNQNS